MCAIAAARSRSSAVAFVMIRKRSIGKVFDQTAKPRRTAACAAASSAVPATGSSPSRLPSAGFNTGSRPASVRVIVPDDVAVRINGEAQFGDLNLLGSLTDGHDVNATHEEAGKRVLVLNLHVGAGAVDVERAVR